MEKIKIVGKFLRFKVKNIKSVVVTQTFLLLGGKISLNVYLFVIFYVEDSAGKKSNLCFYVKINNLNFVHQTNCCNN